jgi:hypothetical protein
MNGLNTFFTFARESSEEIWNDKKLYLPAFLALILLSNMEALYPFFGVLPESGTMIALTLISTLLVFVTLSQIVLIEKRKRGGSGELSFFVPTFLLYNLYYSFLFFLGLPFGILPGLYVLVFFSMVPFVAVLDDEAQGSFFKKSRMLVKKNISLVAWASFFNLIIELSSLVIYPIQDPGKKAIANFFFSFPDAFLTMIITITMVTIYYALNSLQSKESGALG